MDSQVTEPTRRIVPKFSSFKPLKEDSPPASLALKEEKKSSEQEYHEHRSRRDQKNRSRSRGRKGDRKKDKDRKRDPDERRHDRDREKDRNRDQGSSRGYEHRDKDQEHHRRHHHSKSTTAITTQKTRSPSPDSWDAPKKQYYVDTRGDPSNVTYGTIYRYEIPEYRRHGSGCVVGLSSDIRIDREKGDGKGLVLTSKKDMLFPSGGKSSRYAYARSDNDGVKMLRVKKGGGSDDKAFEAGLDFVPISSKLKGKKRKSHPGTESESSEEEDNHYRSLEGLKKVDIKPEDRDLEYASSTDSDKDFIASSEWIDRRRNGELIKKVDANPQNVDIWMEYVNHQDTLLNSNGRKPKLAERRSTAEVKLDILTKALEKCPGDERLLVKYMDVAEVIWDPQRLLLKWKQILRDNPAIIGLWTKYINFRQTDFQSFTYPEGIKSFTECLVVLRSAVFRLGRDNTGSSDKEKLEDIILYVFLRTVLFMREAGYVELAIASFQCMMELNVFNPLTTPPPDTEAALEQLLGKLEEFWDSEVIRIGEPGAKGWAEYVNSGGSGDVPEPREEKLFSGPLDQRDIFGSWMDDEEERLALPMMPARTTDEVEEDDPYRVILFSDFKAFMFYFSVDAVRRKIIDAFLVFSSLTPARPISSNSSGVTDTFLRNDMAYMEDWYLDEWFWPRGVDESIDSKMTAYLEGLSMEPERKSALSKGNPFEFGLKNYPVGQTSLFSWDSINWSQSVKGVDAAFVGRALKMLVDGLGDEKLAVYYLAWISRNRPESVRKVAKALLKNFRTSLLLWNGFAQVEWQDGKVDAARSIFMTTLGMSQGFPEASRRDAIFLWRTWAWKELDDPSQTIRVLLSIESGKLLPEDQNSFNPKNIQPALLLKARRYLDDQQNIMMSMGHTYYAVVYNEVRALLEYLSHDQDISTALSIFDTFIVGLEHRGLTGPQSVVHELCLIAKAQMLYYHARTARIFKMKIMRDALEHAVRLFPNNTIFMGLYAWNEGKTKIENRVRALVRDVVLEEGRETVFGWVFAIWAELRMTGVGGGYSPHAVRSLFEQAVECNQTKSNIGLWMTYVNFEIREKEPRRAKAVLFRGLQCCPWSKNLALLAFKKLRPVLEFEEMRKILSIISSEKELRVHDVTELEDTIGQMTEAQRERLGGVGRPRFLDIPDDVSEDEHMED